VAVVTGRQGTGTHPRAGLANLPRQRCPGLEVWLHESATATPALVA
jgi:hypothetical protein